VELAPQQGDFWNTLGVAHFRAGEWQAAVAALNQSMQLRKGGDSADWFFLAMAHWRRSDWDQARNWYDKAVAGMDSHSPNHEELLRFRAEATALLGIEDQATTRDKKVSPAKEK
jgi:tetratricopeptide (TPR) repeat protein